MTAGKITAGRWQAKKRDMKEERIKGKRDTNENRCK
jgi:hypothetical protein